MLPHRCAELPATKNGEIKGITSGIKEILQIPAFTIELPPGELITAFALVSENGRKIKQKDFIIALEKRGLLKDVTSGQGKRKEVAKKGYAKAKRQYFEKL